MKKIKLMVFFTGLSLLAVKGFASDYMGDLGTLVVTPTRYRSSIAGAATNVSVITRDEIKKSGAVTAAGAIENISTFAESGKRGSRGSERSARIRSGGATASQVLVMIDGQPLNSVSLGEADLEKIPAEHIERIEIVRGPVSAVWGANALGGVINIITARAAREVPETVLSAQAGSYNYAKYFVSHNFKSDDQNIFVTASEEKADGFRENSAYRGNDFLLNAGRKIEGYGNLNIRARYHKSESGVPGTNYTVIDDYDGETETAASSPEAGMDILKRYIQIESIKFVSGSVELKTGVYGSFIDRAYQSPSWSTDDLSQTASYGANIQFALPKSIIAGVDLKEDNFKRMDKSVTPYNFEIDEVMLNSAAYLQKTVDRGGLRIVAGGRYDCHSDWGGIFTPRLSTVFNLTETFKISANAGRAFRPPTFEDLYSPESSWPATIWGPAGDTKGNLNIEPEISWGYDIGFEKKYRSLFGRITLFRSDISDMIEWKDVDPDPAYEQWRPVNVASARNQGVEAELRARLIYGLSANAAYRYLDSRGKSSDDSEFKTLQYTVPVRIKAGLAYESGFGTNINAALNRADKAEWDAGEIEGYTLVSFRASQQISSMEIFIESDNIFDKRYITRLGYPIPGREIRTGMNLRF